ncbi:MAG: NADH-quinone oxidoreductase subunit C/D [Salinisphaera sp.]|nr:NADH-quinone oxidoreductase subunit C/D [Salinisphaera sp.]
MLERTDIVRELEQRFGDSLLFQQLTADGTPTLWIDAGQLRETLRYLKREASIAYRMLFDLTVIDERARERRGDQPASDFTVVYHLLALEPVAEMRIKVALTGESPSIPTITDLWSNANWYEREAWDMFGVTFDGHPNLRRILMPPTWVGHPLRKDHYARATEVDPFTLPPERMRVEEEALRFKPEEWGMKRETEDSEFMFLNLGPNHPSVHGVFRVVAQLNGEEILGAVPDIGYHHRAAEKMGERQSWHTYIPYTDRVDYLGGVMNEMPYLLSVERMLGIEVPPRAMVSRIMLSELFRITSHLLFLGTFVQDIGCMSPIFYMFTDRQKVYDIIEAICGFRMHPAYFRIGGMAMDLPNGWDRKVREFLDWFPARLDEYERMALQNGIAYRRTRGIGEFTVDEGIDWGASGPMLRATGLDWDLRKQRPYAGYDQFDFEVPVGSRGDCFDRAAIRLEEMRQSTRIVRQCLENMPGGPYKSDHPMTTPPAKEQTMQHIETLIAHFLTVSWGPVVAPDECTTMIEATKGLNGYYLVSDGGTISYRTRIRTPSFAHLQMIPTMSCGHMIPDLIAILASIDFVMADVDR